MVKINNIKKVIGIDPGTTTSGTAISLIEIKNKEIFKIKGVYEVTPLVDTLSFTNRVKLISTTIKIITEGFNPDYIFLEFSHYMGKANIMFLKLLGVIESQINYNIEYVYPTQVKKILGSGKMEKQMVAEALKKIYTKDINIIQDFINKNRFDITDSIAIAYAGYYLKSKEE